MIRKLIFLTVPLLWTVTSFGQSAPKYSNEFMQIGVGARWLGMSNSAVSRVDDVTAGYWNPAGLTSMKDNVQIAYMHTNYFAGIGNYDYGAVGIKLNNDNALSVSFVRMGIDGIPNTIDLIQNGQIDYSRITEFSAVDYGFIFSYAQKSQIEGLTYGGSAKIIHRKAGYFATAYGFGVDAGIQYKSKNNFRFAAMARDVTSTFNAWKFNFTESDKAVFAQTGNEIPTQSVEITLPRIILGAGKDFKITDDLKVATEFNFDLTTDGKRNTLIRTGVFSIDPHFGLEVGYLNRIFLRGGIGNVQQVVNPVKNSQGVYEDGKAWTLQPNVGLGLDLKRFALDFAMTNIGNTNDALYSYVFSLQFKINPED